MALASFIDPVGAGRTVPRTVRAPAPFLPCEMIDDDRVWNHCRTQHTSGIALAQSERCQRRAEFTQRESRGTCRSVQLLLVAGVRLATR